MLCSGFASQPEADASKVSYRWKADTGGLGFASVDCGMLFEKVHTIRDIHDGVRSGTADLGGAPHYYSCLFDYQRDEYTDHFELYPVTLYFLKRELQHWAIFRTWESNFHRGLVPVETHPGHGRMDAKYDQLGGWLDAQMKFLKPLPIVYSATFRVIEGQELQPAGVLRELEVCWSPASG